MDEIQDILAKYDRCHFERLLASTPEADQLASTFFKDVAEILDILSRVRNAERNPSGFSIDDAAILGLLVRTWKLLKLIIWIYEEDSAEYAAIAERSLIEVAVTATYLLHSDKSTLEDYRRCSYKNRFRMLEQAASGSEYYRSKAGRRLLRSINEKLALEGLDEHSFEEQKQNDWRLQGKTFHQIFKEVVGEKLYAVAYGTFSNSVHGDWLIIPRESCHPFHSKVATHSTLKVATHSTAKLPPFDGGTSPIGAERRIDDNRYGALYFKSERTPCPTRVYRCARSGRFSA